MPLEITLFVLRIIIALLLYVFLGALFWIIWRDLKASNAQLHAGQRRLGRLVVIESEGEDVPLGRTFRLLPVNSFGRAPTNSIMLPETFASSRHALLIQRGSQWWLEDLQSRNGTTLNGQPMEEAVVVSTGDIIGIGNIQLRLELE